MNRSRSSVFAFIAGVAVTVGLLAALMLSANRQVAEAQSETLDVYYPGTEDLGPDEMRDEDHSP